MQNKTTSRQVKTNTFEGRPMLGSSSEEDERLRVLLEGNDTGHWGTSWWSYLETLSHSGCSRLQIAANNMQTRKSVLKTSSSMNLGRWWISLFIRLKEKERNVRGFEVNAVPVFSRPPSVPTLPLKLPPATGHGLINSTQQRLSLTLCWKRQRVGFLQGSRHHPRLLFAYADSSSAQGHPSPQTAIRVWPSGIFGLVWFAFLLPWIFGFCSDKGAIISEKEGIEVRDWRKRFPGP